MIRILGTIFAGLLGLAFGSFLNVCLSRWPEGESVVQPRSHCRNCEHTLEWWENIPLASWLLLRGRCRSCGERISWRYPLVELAVAGLWALAAWNSISSPLDSVVSLALGLPALAMGIGQMILSWILVALAVFDAEHFWLPDAVTLPGIVSGLALSVARALSTRSPDVGADHGLWALRAAAMALLSAAIAALLILFIRWIYRLVRHREGIGLGDAKLMALLGAWLGLPGAMLAFGVGAVLGALMAMVLWGFPDARRGGHEAESEGSSDWSQIRLPLGTFLCVGGIVSSFWGEPILNAYLRWAGF